MTLGASGRGVANRRRVPWAHQRMRVAAASGLLLLLMQLFCEKLDTGYSQETHSYCGTSAVAALNHVCCGHGEGGGHRRNQAGSCSLPKRCSPSCAGQFLPFMAHCAEKIGVGAEFYRLYFQCQERPTSPAPPAPPPPPTQVRVARERACVLWLGLIRLYSCPCVPAAYPYTFCPSVRVCMHECTQVRACLTLTYPMNI